MGEDVDHQWRHDPGAQESTAVVRRQARRPKSFADQVQDHDQPDAEHLAQVVDEEIEVVGRLRVAAGGEIADYIRGLRRPGPQVLGQRLAIDVPATRERDHRHRPADDHRGSQAEGRTA